MRALSLFTILLFSFKTHGQTDFLPLYQFSEDMREIVLKVPGGHPMGNHEFQLNTEQSDQMEALSGLDDSMKVYLETADDEDCEERFSLTKNELHALRKRVDNRSFQIESVVFTNDRKLEESSVASFTSDDYAKYMGEEYSKGNRRAYDINSISSLKWRFKLVHPEAKLDTLNLAQQEKLLNEFANDYLGNKIPDGLLMKEMAYQALKDNSSDWKNTLALAKDKLSSEQKIQLVSKLGGIFGDNYNYDRSDDWKNEQGKFVKIEELLDSAKLGTPGGVCRDIALAQTQVLQELGFKNNYVVAFKSLSGSHATVITTDPVTGKVVKFNYNETTEYSKKTGTEVLEQDTSLPDYGTNFRIYDSKGKAVTKVTSELGQILKSSTNIEKDRDFNQRNFSIAKVGFSTPYVNGNLFTGKTSSGDTIYGVSLFKDVVNNDYAKLDLGASVSERKGERSLVTIDQQNLFLLANAEVSSPSLKIGPTENKVFGGADVSLLVSNTKETNREYKSVRSSKGEMDLDANFVAGLQNVYNSENKKISVDSKAYVNLYPDWNHVASAEKKVLNKESIVVRSGVTYNFTEDTRALIDTAVIMRNYGTSMVSKAIVEDDKRGMRYIAGVATPITKEMPTFLPGNESRVFGGIEHESKNLVFSIEVERNLHTDSNSVGIKGKYKF